MATRFDRWFSHLLRSALASTVALAATSAHAQSAPNPAQSQVRFPTEQCGYVTETDPPFLVTKGEPSVQRPVQQGSAFVDGYYPAGTIVKVTDESFWARYVPGTMLSVKVLSVPPERIGYNFRYGVDSYTTSDLQGRGRRAQVGDVGQIRSTDLWIGPFGNTANPDEQVFQVRYDATRFNLPGINGRAVRLAKHQGKYLTNRCCDIGYAKDTMWEGFMSRAISKSATPTYPHESTRDPRCRYAPVFELLRDVSTNPNAPPQLVTERLISPPATNCDAFLGILTPIAPQNLRTVLNLASITARLSDAETRLIEQTAWANAIEARGSPRRGGNESKSLCAQAVRETLQELGLLDRTPGWPGRAIGYHTEGYLTRKGWRDVSSVYPSPESAPAGCVIVYSGGDAGHIEIKVGENGYCSDYCSNTPITRNPRIRRNFAATYCPSGGPRR